METADTDGTINGVTGRLLFGLDPNVRLHQETAGVALFPTL